MQQKKGGNFLNNRERNSRIAHEVLILLGVIAFFSFLCRIWPIILLAFLGAVLVAVHLLVWKREEPSASPERPVTPENHSDEHSVFQTAYPLIVRQITAMVAQTYPEAEWVWDSPKVRQKIENGEDVGILLNRAGGYRRATVRIVALCVKGLDYQTAPDTQKADTPADSVKPEETGQDITEPLPENYELLAAEWVEAHMIELNARCNQAIGQRQDCLLLRAEELPKRESWPSIREELIRAELNDVACTEEGIQINFTQREQKGMKTYE